MDTKELQLELKKLKLYDGEIDDLHGEDTQSAISKLLSSSTVHGYGTWSKERQRNAAEQVIYEKAKIEVGQIDGLVGPQTRYARDVWKGRKAGTSIEEIWRDGEDKGPLPKPTEQNTHIPTQANVAQHYGHVGSNQVMLTTPYPLVLAWDLGKVVTRISVHKKVKEATERVLEVVEKHYGMEEIKRLKLNVFGGSLNVRKMRGGSSWSMHSWGIALDFDPERNQLKWNNTRAVFAKKEYDYWWKAWEGEGGVSLGRRKNYDWIHVQFARV